MELDLKNPLVFLDLETTGLDISKDRIVEIALLKINTNSIEEEILERVNPEKTISAEAISVHGITNDDVADKPTFKQLAKTLANFIKGCDLAGFNSNRFDIPLLAEEFMRAEVDIDLKKRKFIDVQTIFHKMERRTLVAAYKYYCDKDLTDAHSAMADTKATYEVLKSQLDLYKGKEIEENGKKFIPIVNDVKELSEFSTVDKFADYAGRIVYNDKGEEVFNFGKNKGISVEKVLSEQPGYYQWMMENNFPLYTKTVLSRIKLRMSMR
ncbi:MAG: exonuclease domain-containing protein [Bacteroidales bacterium]